MKKGILTLVALFATIGLWAQTQPTKVQDVKLDNGKTITIYSNGT
jgi:hypothetical protein